MSVDPEEPYRVRLDLFEGPLDLLLHLCRQQEVEITDISIATITEQYLEYLELMKQLNLEVAASFLAMAATLCEIKSIRLLPVAHEVDGDEDGPDPRQELIQRLLEYRQFKDAAARLADREILDRDSFQGEATDAEDEDPALRPVESNLFELLDALRELLARRDDVIDEHRVSLSRFTVAEQMRAVVRRMQGQRKLAFEDLFDPSAGREEILVTFLALLEMIRLQFLKVVQRGHLDRIALRLDYVGSAEDLPVPGEEEEEQP